MTSNQEAAPNDKPVTSIVDHLFKEFLAKKSEVLQQESTVECQQNVKAEEISTKGEPDQNTSDISEEMHSRKHSERHDNKKEKKHKKHKHKEKSHSKKKHKHKRHHSDREYDKIDVKNDSEIDRWTNDELKIDTDTGSDVTDTLTQQDGLKHHSHLSSKDDASLLSATDADSKNNDKQHKKYKKGERRLDSGGQPTKLEHLWQEEEVSDKELDQASTHPSLQDDSTMESEVTSGVTGGWMTLPKELEKNPAVNADNWMKLPDDLSNLEKDHLAENDHLVDDVNSKKACSNPDCNEASEQNSEQSRQPALKLDIKIDISKVAKVLPPPTHITKEVVSSIKSTLNNDVIKSEETQDKPPVFEPETSHEKPETDMEKMEPKVPPGKMKLGIKISETSAALISSGKKMDDNMADTTAEEGEITDSATSGQADGAPDKDLDSRSSSEISVGHLSSSDSVSGSDSGDEKRDQDSPKRKERKHKKKKKKGHKRKKRERSSSRSHSWKKHKHSRSRSSSRSKSRSRSRSRSRSGRDIRAKSFDEERGVWRSRSRSKSRSHRRSRSPDYYSRHSRETYYRSKSRDHHYDYHRSRPYHRYKSRSRSKSRSKSPAVKEPTQDARLQIDKAQLRKIAFQNAYAHLRKGQLPNLGLKPAEVAALKAGGKSVEELTDFCKKISEKGESFIPSEESDADGKENSSDNEAPFVHHPFKMRDNASIVMNIRNARQLPVLTSAQKQALGNELRLQFPVSSGTQHRDKEREWVPVETPNTTSTASIAATMAKPDMKPDAMVTPAAAGPMKPDDKVFPDVPNVQINIRDVVSERLSALRRLSENPNDPQAMGAMCRAQEAMNKWVQSKDLPGYFTGSTGANVLSQAELAGMTQAWARKDQLINAAPVTGGIGKFLLKKMGWKEGEGLGKAGAGSKEPIMLDFKLDRKGLASTGEAMKKTPTIPLTKDLSNKHPVSALVELCNRRKWQPPNFVLVHESGPDHKKNFLFKVIVNGNEYQSTIVSTNKKHAKAQAATVCLQQLGLVPR